MPIDASSSGALQASLTALRAVSDDALVLGALTVLATKPMQVVHPLVEQDMAVLPMVARMRVRAHMCAHVHAFCL